MEERWRTRQYLMTKRYGWTQGGRREQSMLVQTHTHLLLTDRYECILKVLFCHYFHGTNRWILMNFMQFIFISDSLQDKNSPKCNICTIKVAHIINTLYSKSPEFWIVVVVWPVFVVLIWCFWCLWRLTDMVSLELYEKTAWKSSFVLHMKNDSIKWQNVM